jgi:hypothetical protein
VSIKKISLYLLLTLSFSNFTEAQSLLPECKGNNKNISSFSAKYFLKVRKWTKCQGTAISPKGDIYVGEFFDGKFHGQGIFKGQDGRKYVGEYKNHKKHGQGTYTYSNGDKYVGEWKKAKYSGYGTFFYSNGDKYIGKWKKGRRHGEGTLILVNTNKIKKGIWKNDKLIKQK